MSQTDSQKYSDLIRECLALDLENTREHAKLNVKLKSHLLTLVSYLTGNTVNNVTSWLSYSRTFVVALHTFMYHSSDNAFFHLIESYWKAKSDMDQLYLPMSSFLVGNHVAFQAAVSYGFMHLISLRRSEFTETQLHIFYYVVFKQSANRNRHSRIYIRILSELVHSFPTLLKESDYDHLFTFCTMNIGYKECCNIMQCCFDKTENTSIKTVVDQLGPLLWKERFKYQMLTEILRFQERSVDIILSKEEIKEIIKTQSKPHLISVGSKLFTKILKSLPEEGFIEVFWAQIENVISSSKTSKLQLENIIKHYFPAIFNAYKTIFPKIFSKLLNNANIPNYVKLSVVKYGIRFALFEKNYDFTQIIHLGINDIESCNRDLSFQILCYTSDFNAIPQIRRFLILNSNDSDQLSRNSITLSYDVYLSNLQGTVCAPNCDENTKKTVAQFIDYMITFLINNFNNASTYQRITYSFLLLEVTFDYFSYYPKEHENCREQLKMFMGRITFFETVQIEAFLNIYKNVVDIYKDNALEFIMKFLGPSKVDNTVFSISTIIETGKAKLVEGVIEKSETGQRLIVYGIYFLSASGFDVQHELKELVSMMAQQWTEWKESENENICYNIPLHPVISVIYELVEFFVRTDYEMLMNSVVELVTNLLPVFELRASLPFRGNNCKGIANVFSNPQSQYYSRTVNCTWLVLKAICKLVVKLVDFIQTDFILHRSVYILHSIMNRCYHKGALEMAGGSLREIVELITRNGYSTKFVRLYVNIILSDILVAVDTRSTVRRSAEVRTFLTAVATSDKRLQKALFHHIVNNLMVQLHSCLMDKTAESNARHVLILNCLSEILNDSSIDGHGIEHISNFSISVLKSFESDNWPVRNAAIQAFRTVISKLLGPNMSHNDSERVVNIEEIIYKYPDVISYIIDRIKCWQSSSGPHLGVIKPILTLLSLTRTRGENFVNEEIANQMATLRQHLSAYLCDMPNSSIYRLLVCAYVNTLFYPKISDEVNTYISIYKLEHNRSENIFPTLFLVKTLCDKLDNDLTYCTISYPTHFGRLLGSFIRTIQMNNSPVDKLWSELLLHKYTDPIFRPRKFQSYFRLICNDKSLVYDTPMIWDLFTIQITDTVNSCAVKLLPSLIYACLEYKASLDFKITFMIALKNRIGNIGPGDIKFKTKILYMLLHYLYDWSFMDRRPFIDECIECILNMDLSIVTRSWLESLFSHASTIMEHKIPVYYMAVYCALFVHYTPTEPVKEFYRFCLFECIAQLDQEEIDHTIFKSILYTAEFGIINKDLDLLVKLLHTTYTMLQRGDEQLNAQCCRIVQFCFRSEPMSSFYITKKLITNPITLIPLIGLYHTVQLLSIIYSEQNDNVVELRETEWCERPVKAINTKFIANDIINGIKYTLYRFSKSLWFSFFEWFKEYISKLTPTKYTDIVVELFGVYNKLFTDTEAITEEVQIIKYDYIDGDISITYANDNVKDPKSTIHINHHIGDTMIENNVLDLDTVENQNGSEFEEDNNELRMWEWVIVEFQYFFDIEAGIQN